MDGYIMIYMVLLVLIMQWPWFSSYRALRSTRASDPGSNVHFEPGGFPLGTEFYPRD